MSGSVRVGLMASGEEAAVQRLLAQPMGGAWGLSYGFPAGLAPGLALYGSPVHVVVARDDAGVVACGIRAVRPVWWEGKPARLGYLALLRQHPRLSPWARPGILASSLACLAATRQPDELPWDLTAIVDGNQRARRLLERGVGGAPVYHRLIGHCTEVFAGKRLAASGSAGVRPAGEGDLAEIMRLCAPRATDQLIPRVAVSGVSDWWVSDGPTGLAGCIHLADVRAQRSMRVTAVPPLAQRLRPLIGVLRHLRGLAALPQRDTELPLGYLEHLRCADELSSRQRAALTRQLVSAAAQAAHRRGCVQLLAGATAAHPRSLALGAADRVRASWYAVGGQPRVSGHWEQGLASL